MQRAKFAGAEAGIGILVLSLFYILGVLGVVGVGMLIAGHQVPSWGAGEYAAYVGFVVAVIVWGALIMRELRCVRVVQIADDGTWILKGPLGMKRGTIAPGEPRAVHDRERAAWIFGVPRRFTLSWCEIESGTRRWRTSGGIPSSQRAARDLLQQWVVDHRSR
jgi:hypothetical protein